jgi:hypothetical protein
VGLYGSLGRPAPHSGQVCRKAWLPLAEGSFTDTINQLTIEKTFLFEKVNKNKSWYKILC